jgi:lysozyme
MRKTNAAGIALIKANEGLRLTPYRDVAELWTIGYGHKLNHAPDPNWQISEQDAEDILRRDLELFETGVSKMVTVPLTDNQFAALVAFTFNVGLGAFSKSTMLRLLNEGSPAVAHEFDRWNKVDGNVVLGLVHRRQAEKDLFLKGDA